MNNSKIFNLIIILINKINNNYHNFIQLINLQVKINYNNNPNNLKMQWNEHCLKANKVLSKKNLKFFSTKLMIIHVITNLRYYLK